MKSKSQQRRESVMKTGKLPKVKTPTCVMCGGKLQIWSIEFYYEFRPISLVCANPKCPNYGLLQVGNEKMFEVENRFPKNFGKRKRK